MSPRAKGERTDVELLFEMTGWPERDLGKVERDELELASRKHKVVIISCTLPPVITVSTAFEPPPRV